jgi:hypothetical protein
MAMTRSHILALLALIVVPPAAGLGARTIWSADEAPCFSADGTGYRLTQEDDADYTVRIAADAMQSDLTLQMVDDAEIADFVLVDGLENSRSCQGAQRIRTIRVDAQAHDPDLTIAVVPPDGIGRYKIYAHAANVTVQDAAALFAVMIQAGHKSAALRNLTARGDDITGALTSRSPRSARQ